ncbi:MAG: sigma-70 family RNA polymerase sigma factor [Oscillospiraceae bacterium]|nr:sigma-70 family RNA polymerase sigma factor [Oscillospiraceae bacterium]
MEGAARNQIITQLYDCYMANGFITEDEALSLFAAYDTPLHQIDSITEQILAMGVIITSDDDELSTDRSFTEYNAIYDEFIELAPEFKPFIEFVRNITPPQYLEWKKLIPQAKNGNEYAKNRLIEMYMRAAVRQALYYSKKYLLPLDDTLQDALTGVISAIDRYNPAEHMNYNANIQWWITSSITRNCWIHSIPIYFPVHIKEKLLNIINEAEEHFCEYCPENRMLHCPELVKFLSKKQDWTIENTERYLFYLICWESLEQITDNEDDISDDGLLIDELHDSFIKSDYKGIIMELLDNIKPREKEVLLYRNGFTEKGALTLEEIGHIYGVTRERIRQLEEKAIRRMRHPTRLEKLKELL